MKIKDIKNISLEEGEELIINGEFYKVVKGKLLHSPVLGMRKEGQEPQSLKDICKELGMFWTDDAKEMGRWINGKWEEGKKKYEGKYK